MKKRTILKRTGYGFIILFILINLLILVTDTTYLYKAVIYRDAGIDDLDIFEFREVDADNPRPWPVASDYNRQKPDTTLQNALERFQSVAFLVVKNDSIKYEHYWDNYSEKSLSNSFSVAKSIISILIGIAVDEGKIRSIDQPVSEYLPEFKEGDKAKITIRHLLTMSSGLSFMESYSTPVNETTEAYYGKDLRKLIKRLRVIEEPGTVYRYKSGDTQVLEMILKKATGMDVSDYASSRLWSPIGAEHDAKWSIDRIKGDEKAYCCFYSNARDFARIGRLYMNDGKWDSTQIVSASYVKESLRPHGLKDKNGNGTDYYGFQWWLLNHHNLDIFYARGLLGQYIVVIPAKKMIIVRLGKFRSDVKIGDHPEDVIRFIDGALQMYP